MDNSLLNEKYKLLSTDFIPNYNQLFIHPEQGQDAGINNSLNEIKKDFNILNDNIIDKANSIDLLLANTIKRLNIIEKKIYDEKERLQDICMLCNKYTDFDKVVNITDQNTYGKYSYYNDTFYSALNSSKKISIGIEDILGNGLEGNRYVYKDFKYVKNSLDTSNRKALTDNKLSTYWEYQRITVSSLEENIIHDFNVDSEEAKCTLTIYSNDQINQLEINNENLNLKVTRIQYSDNGLDYDDLELPYITLNNKNDSYSNIGYTYGSNLLYIPNAYYVKVTLQSNGYTNDEIAFDKVLFKDELFDEQEINDVLKETTIIKSAKRHVIKLNDVIAYKNNYFKDSYIKTNELINDNKLYAIGIFANTYVPNNLTSETITFTLTVNGVDYNIIPVNSESNGTKIIRFSKSKSKTEYTKYIDEAITSVVLTIKLKSYKDLTPYLNNIKVLLGGEI